MTAPVSGRFRNNEVKKNISAGGTRRPEIFLPSKSYYRISFSGRLGSKGGRMGMMRKLSPRGERQLTCPHISSSSQRRICTAVANLCLSSSASLIILHLARVVYASREIHDSTNNSGYFINRSAAASAGLRTDSCFSSL